MAALRQSAVWLVLCAVLGGFLIYRDALGLERNFGYLHDDTIYVSTGQALADGRGYIAPSVPGEPAQTKYPVLYPWLLAALWPPSGDIGVTTNRAVQLSAFFSLAYLVGAFLLIRRWCLGGPWLALACAGFTAFHFFFLRLSGAVMSDVPFAAFAVWGICFFERAGRSDRGAKLAWAAGLLAGLAVATRTAGLALPCAFFLLLAYRRQWPLVLPAVLPAFAVTAAGFVWKAGLSEHSVAYALPGFQQTWLYWTAYGAFWLESVPDFGVLWNMLNSNAVDAIVSPSEFVFGPWLASEGGTLGLLASVSLTAGIFSGWWREAKADRLPAIALVFLGTLPLVLIWNYPIADRLLMVFLPFFFAGAVVELRHVGRALVAAWRKKPPIADRVVLAGFGLLLCAAVGIAAHGYTIARVDLGVVADQHAEHWDEADSIYAWVRENTDSQDRLIASEDVHLYLHTGRQAMWPLALTTQGFFDTDPVALTSQLDRFFDVAIEIRARYWVVADTDYRIESRSPAFAEALNERVEAFPELFRSPGGTMRVLELRNLERVAANFRSPQPVTEARSVTR